MADTALAIAPCLALRGPNGGAAAQAADQNATNRPYGDSPNVGIGNSILSNQSEQRYPAMEQTLKSSIKAIKPPKIRLRTPTRTVTVQPDSVHVIGSNSNVL